MSKAVPIREWTELDNGFLSEPGKYYLITRKLRQFKSGVRKKTEVVELVGETPEDLDAQLLAFTERPDVVLVDE